MHLRRFCQVTFATVVLGVAPGCAHPASRQTDPTTFAGKVGAARVARTTIPAPTPPVNPREALEAVTKVLAQMFPTTTTSTSVAAPKVIPPRQQPRVGGSGPVTNPQATGTVNGFPCGGLLPSCCTLQMESGGNPTIIEGHGDPFSHASGLWQFMPSTWNNYQGYPYAAAAPPEIQNQKAIEVFAGGAGASNWYGDGCYGGR